MRQKLLTILIPTLMMTTGLHAYADTPSGLTEEQIRHEKELSELRKQKEILDIKHAQAVLLRDCQEMGIDCRSNSLKVIDYEEESFIKDINDIATRSAATEMPSFTPDVSTKSHVPKLEAIQNSSAQLSQSGESHWAMVGDTVGDWKVVHIDASKVRIKHEVNSETKTLLLNW